MIAVGDDTPWESRSEVLRVGEEKNGAVLCAAYPQFAAGTGLEAADFGVIPFDFALALDAEEGQFPDEHLPLGVEVDLNGRGLTRHSVESVEGRMWML